MVRVESVLFSPDDPRNGGSRDMQKLPLAPNKEAVFRLLVNGLSRAEVAESLGLSLQTVKFYIHGGRERTPGVRESLGAVSTLDAIVKAIPYVSFREIVDDEKVRRAKSLNDEQRDLLDKRIEHSNKSFLDFANTLSIPLSSLEHQFAEINKHIGVHKQNGSVAAYLATIQPTPKQQEVLRLAAYGFKQKDIAKKLGGVEVSTVDSYMYGKSGDLGLFDKFRVDTRTGLVIKAARMHFLEDVIHEYDIKRLRALNNEQIGLLQTIADNAHLTLPELAAELSVVNRMRITREMLEQQLGNIYRLTGAPNMTAAALLLIAGQQQDSRYVRQTYHFPERRALPGKKPDEKVPKEAIIQEDRSAKPAPVDITLDDVHETHARLRKEWNRVPAREEIAEDLGVKLSEINELFDKMRAQASPKKQSPEPRKTDRIEEETEQAWQLKEQMEAPGEAPIVVFDSTQEEERIDHVLDEETIRAMRRFPIRQRRALELLHGVGGQTHSQQDVARELHMTLREVKRVERALRRRVRNAYLGKVRKRRYRR